MTALDSSAPQSHDQPELECGRLALRAAEVIHSGPFAPDSKSAVLLALVNARAAVTWLRTTSSGSGGRAVNTEPLPEEVRAALARTADEDLRADPSDAWKDLELVRAYARRLLSAAERPARRARAERRRARARLLALPLAALLVVGVTVGWVARSRDVSAGKPWTTSSKAFECDPVHATCGGHATSILFHTNFEENPWFELDLGAVHEVTRVVVHNRSDYCPDCAVPLVVETSLDRQHYRTVARKFAVFDEWEQRFPAARARYVRVRVTRPSVLHLEAVRVFGSGPK
ncbi:MAG TPA: discoidin domain-containing protein [Polyangiaceae bacterium]